MRIIRNYSPLQDAVLNDFFNKGISHLVGNDTLNTNPMVNISENPERFQIQLAAPGLTREDFEIQLEKNRLQVRSVKDEQTLGEGARYNRRAFDYSNFTRSFNLPETINTENICANYDNGILYINIPKKAEVIVVPKNIEVQ